MKKTREQKLDEDRTVIYVEECSKFKTKKFQIYVDNNLKRE